MGRYTAHEAQTILNAETPYAMTKPMNFFHQLLDTEVIRFIYV